MSASKAIFGLIVITCGIFLLGVNLNLWSSAIAFEMWRFWPLLIIFVGLRLVIKNDLFFLATASITLILSITLALLFTNNLPNPAPVSRSGEFESHFNIANKVTYDIALGGANINVLPKNDKGLFSGNYLGLLNTKVDQKDKNGDVFISIRENIEKPFWKQGNKREINLSLAKKIPTDFSISTGASSFDLDFSETYLTKFVIKSGATSGLIRLGKPTGVLPATISTGVSSYEILVPQDIPVKITTSGALTSQNFENFGLIKEGKNFTSNDYDNAVDKIFITLESGVSSISVKNY